MQPLTKFTSPRTRALPTRSIAHRAVKHFLLLAVLLPASARLTHSQQREHKLHAWHTSLSTNGALRLRGGAEELQGVGEQVRVKRAPVRVRPAETAPETTVENQTVQTASETPARKSVSRATGRGRGGRGRGGRGRGAAPASTKAVQKTRTAASASASDQAAPHDTSPRSALTQFVGVAKGVVEWQNPSVSAAVLVVGNLLFAAVASGAWSAASVLGTLAFYALLLSNVGVLLWRAAQHLLARRPMLRVINDAAAVLPSVLRPGADLLDAEAIAAAARASAEQLNELFNFCKRLGSATEASLTLSALAAAYFLKLAGPRLSILGLLWGGFVCGLCVPKLYELYGDDMHRYLKVLHDSVMALVAAAVDAVPTQWKSELASIWSTAPSAAEEVDAE